MKEEPEIRATTITRDAVVDDKGNLTVAFLRFNIHTKKMGFHWLPEFFAAPIPDILRDDIVRRLRLHADKLESGELDKTMQQFASINTPEEHQ